MPVSLGSTVAGPPDCLPSLCRPLARSSYVHSTCRTRLVPGSCGWVGLTRGPARDTYVDHQYVRPCSRNPAAESNADCLASLPESRASPFSRGDSAGLNRAPTRAPGSNCYRVCPCRGDRPARRPARCGAPVIRARIRRLHSWIDKCSKWHGFGGFRLIRSVYPSGLEDLVRLCVCSDRFPAVCGPSAASTDASYALASCRSRPRLDRVAPMSPPCEPLS